MVKDKTKEAIADDFHVVVGAGLVEGRATDNEQALYELKMLKSALLYADRTTLISLTSACVAPVFALTSLPRRDTANLLDKCLPQLLSQFPDPDQFRSAVKLHKRLASRRGSLSKPQAAQLNKLDHLARYLLEGIQEGVINRLSERGVKGFEAALKTGLVSFASTDKGRLEAAITTVRTYLSTKGDMTHWKAYVESAATEYVESLSQAVSGRNYLWFDQTVGEGIGSVVLGDFKPSAARVTRAKHLALAADVMQRLPMLDEASFDEIVDIRREYEKPLKQFRAAVMGFTDKIQSAPWDKDFPLEAEDLFRAQVEPAVADIEEQMKENKFISELLRRARGSDINISSGSGLGIALSSLYFLPDMASKMLGMGLGAAFLVSDAYKAWKEKQREVERNQMYFYYQAKRRLARK